MREGLGFEVADREFDDGVLAMFASTRVICSVRLVTKARCCQSAQLGLLAEQSDATDDEPVAAVGRLGDLGFAASG